MTGLPVISGRRCIRVLLDAGFVAVRQSGSHISMVRNDPFALVVVPLHKEIRRGTLRAIIRQAGMSVDEFVELLNK